MSALLLEDERPKVNVGQPILQTEKLVVSYGRKPAFHEMTLAIAPKEVTAIIGPSGCGKSTLLKVFNRMLELNPEVSITGRVSFHDEDILSRRVDPIDLRLRIGMVFQKPNPFEMSIFDNVAYGPKLHGIRKRSELEGVVEQALRQASLWGSVKDKLHHSALQLSGGEQQRLCIARTLANDPEVILMDEPCSALDPQATFQIEETMGHLAKDRTILIVTHNLGQAQRASRSVIFIDYDREAGIGELIEHCSTDDMFERPTNRRTEDYISGRYG